MTITAQIRGENMELCSNKGGFGKIARDRGGTPKWQGREPRRRRREESGNTRGSGSNDAVQCDSFSAPQGSPGEGVLPRQRVNKPVYQGHIAPATELPQHEVAEEACTKFTLERSQRHMYHGG